MLLEVSDLRISYGDIRAGKTSILGGIMGMVPVRQGSIRFKGREMSRLASFERARSGMRLVPERARVFPRLSVQENLLTGVYGLRRRIDVGRRIAWLHELFPILKERRGQPASTLSGGEQQQLAIARALVSNPDLLLVDEVSMGLMPKLVDQVFEVLAQLNREHGLTILLVEQNAMASLEISHRAYVLETGRCVFEGRAEDLLKDPKLKAAYLGE
jgi:branched-chain amino acid transport system ATP-binding protein